MLRLRACRKWYKPFDNKFARRIPNVPCSRKTLRTTQDTVPQAEWLSTTSTLRALKIEVEARDVKILDFERQIASLSNQLKTALSEAAKSREILNSMVPRSELDAAEIVVAELRSRVSNMLSEHRNVLAEKNLVCMALEAENSKFRMDLQGMVSKPDFMAARRLAEIKDFEMNNLKSHNKFLFAQMKSSFSAELQLFHSKVEHIQRTVGGFNLAKINLDQTLAFLVESNRNLEAKLVRMVPAVDLACSNEEIQRLRCRVNELQGHVNSGGDELTKLQGNLQEMVPREEWLTSTSQLRIAKDEIHNLLDENSILEKQKIKVLEQLSTIRSENERLTEMMSKLVPIADFLALDSHCKQIESQFSQLKIEHRSAIQVRDEKISGLDDELHALKISMQTLVPRSQLLLARQAANHLEMQLNEFSCLAKRSATDVKHFALGELGVLLVKVEAAQRDITKFSLHMEDFQRYQDVSLRAQYNPIMNVVFSDKSNVPMKSLTSKGVMSSNDKAGDMKEHKGNSYQKIILDDSYPLRSEMELEISSLRQRCQDLTIELRRYVQDKKNLLQQEVANLTPRLEHMESGMRSIKQDLAKSVLQCKQHHPIDILRARKDTQELRSKLRGLRALVSVYMAHARLVARNESRRLQGRIDQLELRVDDLLSCNTQSSLRIRALLQEFSLVKSRTSTFEDSIHEGYSILTKTDGQTDHALEDGLYLNVDNQPHHQINLETNPGNDEQFSEPFFSDEVVTFNGAGVVLEEQAGSRAERGPFSESGESSDNNFEFMGVGSEDWAKAWVMGISEGIYRERGPYSPDSEKSGEECGENDLNSKIKDLEMHLKEGETVAWEFPKTNAPFPETVLFPAQLPSATHNTKKKFQANASTQCESEVWKGKDEDRFHGRLPSLEANRLDPWMAGSDEVVECISDSQIKKATSWSEDAEDQEQDGGVEPWLWVDNEAAVGHMNSAMPDTTNQGAAETASIQWMMAEGEASRLRDELECFGDELREKEEELVKLRSSIQTMVPRCDLFAAFSIARVLLREAKIKNNRIAALEIALSVAKGDLDRAKSEMEGLRSALRRVLPLASPTALSPRSPQSELSPGMLLALIEPSNLGRLESCTEEEHEQQWSEDSSVSEVGQDEKDHAVPPDASLESSNMFHDLGSPTEARTAAKALIPQRMHPYSGSAATLRERLQSATPASQLLVAANSDCDAQGNEHDLKLGDSALGSLDAVEGEYVLGCIRLV